MKFDFIIFSIYWGIFLSYSNNSVISAFFPQFADDSVGITESLVGVIFSTYSIGVFVSSLLTSKIMSSNPQIKKKCIITGIIIELFGQGILGILKFIDNNNVYVFVILSVTGRVVGGIGQGIFMTPAYSIIPILYRETMEEKIGQIEAVAGLGLSLGPVIGGALYTYGYEIPFIFGGGACIFILPFLFIYFPNNLLESKELLVSFFDESAQNKPILIEEKQENDNFESQNDEQYNTYIEQPCSTNPKDLKDNKDTTDDIENDNYEYSIDYFEILKNRHIFLPYIIVILNAASIVYLDPTLGIEEYNMDPNLIGTIFLVGAFFYLVFCPVGSWICKKWKQYKTILFIGCVISGMSMISMGPDHQITGIPVEIWVTFLSQVTMGIGNVLVFIPVIPDMMDSIKLKYSFLHHDIVSDIASGLFNSSMAMGSFLGPCAGGFLADFLGFPRASSYFGISLIGFALMYFFLGGVLSKAKIQTNVEDLPKVNLRIGDLSKSFSSKIGASFLLKKSMMKNSQIAQSFQHGELKRSLALSSKNSFIFDKVASIKRKSETVRIKKKSAHIIGSQLQDKQQDKLLLDQYK